MKYVNAVSDIINAFWEDEWNPKEARQKIEETYALLELLGEEHPETIAVSHE